MFSFYDNSLSFICMIYLHVFMCVLLKKKFKRERSEIISPNGGIPTAQTKKGDHLDIRLSTTISFCLQPSPLKKEILSMGEK